MFKGHRVGPRRARRKVDSDKVSRGNGVPCRALWVIVRIVAFIGCDMQRHWRVLSGVTRSDFH